MKKILLLLLAAAPLFGATQIKWQDNYNQAARMAKSERRPMLLFFHASWCGPCKKLKSEVFSKSAFADKVSSKIIFVSIMEGSSPENDKLAQEFNIKYYPTVILLNKDGKKIGQISRKGEGPTQFANKINSMISVNEGAPTQNVAAATEEESLFF